MDTFSVTVRFPKTKDSRSTQSTVYGHWLPPADPAGRGRVEMWLGAPCRGGVRPDFDDEAMDLNEAAAIAASVACTFAEEDR